MVRRFDGIPLEPLHFLKSGGTALGQDLPSGVELLVSTLYFCSRHVVVN